MGHRAGAKGQITNGVAEGTVAGEQDPPNRLVPDRTRQAGVGETHSKDISGAKINKGREREIG